MTSSFFGHFECLTIFMIVALSVVLIYLLLRPGCRYKVIEKRPLLWSGTCKNKQQKSRNNEVRPAPNIEPILSSTETARAVDFLPSKYGEAIQRETAAYMIRLCTYNIRCDKDPPPFNLGSRMEHLSNTLNQIRPDIICLQEARDVYCTTLVNQLNGVWEWVGVPRKRNDEGAQVVFRKDYFSLISNDTFVLTDPGGPLKCDLAACTEPSVFSGTKSSHVRIFTHARLLHLQSRHEVNVINTHFPLTIHEQWVCAAQLGHYVRSEVTPGGIVFVCGDFNSHYSPSEIPSPISTELVQKSGLIDVLNSRDVCTFTEGFEEELDRKLHRLDYILFSLHSQLKLEFAEVPHILFELNGKKFRPSDHEPIVANFVLSQ